MFSASESFFIFRFFIEHLPVRRRTSYNNRTDSTGTFFLNMRRIYRTLCIRMRNDATIRRQSRNFYGIRQVSL